MANESTLEKQFHAWHIYTCVIIVYVHHELNMNLPLLQMYTTLYLLLFPLHLLGHVKLQLISLGYGKTDFPTTSILCCFYQKKVKNFFKCPQKQPVLVVMAVWILVRKDCRPGSGWSPSFEGLVHSVKLWNDHNTITVWSLTCPIVVLILVFLTLS